MKKFLFIALMSLSSCIEIHDICVYDTSQIVDKKIVKSEKSGTEYYQITVRRDMNLINVYVIKYDFDSYNVGEFIDCNKQNKPKVSDNIKQ